MTMERPCRVIEGIVPEMQGRVLQIAGSQPQYLRSLPFSYAFGRTWAVCRVLLKATSVPEMLEGAFPRPQTTERPPRNDVRPILSAAKGVEAALAQTCAKRAKPFSQGSGRL